LLSVIGRALLGVVSTLATSETGVVAAAVLYDWLLAEGLALVAWLAVVATIVPHRFVLR
jgi:hypothetical protein